LPLSLHDALPISLDAIFPRKSRSQINIVIVVIRLSPNLKLEKSAPTLSVVELPSQVRRFPPSPINHRVHLSQQLPPLLAVQWQQAIRQQHKSQQPKNWPNNRCLTFYELTISHVASTSRSSDGRIF